MLQPDKYAYCNSLSQVHPAEKFFFAIATMVICLTANSHIVSIIVILLMTGVSVLIGSIPFRFYLKLMLIPAIFTLVGVLTIAINPIHPALTDKLIWGCQLSDFTFGITAESLTISAILFLRSLGVASCMLFLALTTPLVDIISILRKLKVPELFLEIMSLVYRFLFVLLETSSKIYTSQSARLGYSDLKKGYQSMGLLVSCLFIHSYRRSRDLYTALEARGYSGHLKVLEQDYRISKRNLSIIFVVELLLIITALADRSNL